MNGKSTPCDWPVLKTYEGAFLRRLKMPLGGIGTGTVSLAGRGALVDWELRGSPAAGFTPAYNRASSGFWLRTENASGVRGRLLEGPLDEEFYEGEEGTMVPNHGFPRFSKAVFRAAYPLAQVALEDPDVPVRATLEAMNPLVPGDEEASGIPAVLLRWRLANATDEPVRVSLGAILVNPAGGKPLHSRVSARGLSGVSIGSEDLSPADNTLGRASILLPDGIGAVSSALDIPDPGWMVRWDDLWRGFLRTGRFDDAAVPDERTPAVALAVSAELAPGEEKTFPFLLAWRFPHRPGWHHGEYRAECIAGPFAPERDVGNHYANVYASPEEAAETLWNDLPALEAKTIGFVRSVLDKPAPAGVKEAALFNLSTLRTETCFRTADGHFFGWEGCFANGGSCYGNCTHVWGYEHALIDLWPALAKDMTTLQFTVQSLENGAMDFRVGLPLATHGRSNATAADGQMQCLVKAYENWRRTGDDAWMRSLYPAIRRSLEYCWRPGSWDADRDGVMEGRQHNTMDVDYYGPNPQMEFLYLAALEAVARMADAADDAAFAAECRALRANGSAWTEKHLFNGAYYEHLVDGEHDYQLAAGCLVDQLLGDTAARHAGLGPVADEAHARTALDTILDKCSSETVGAVYNCGRDYSLPGEPSLRMAWYPEDRIPKNPFPYYRENMTGFEYIVALGLAQRGDTARAERVVRNIRDRYDGRKRNPFNEAECGNHYVRALAAWTVLADWPTAADAADERKHL